MFYLQEFQLKDSNGELQAQAKWKRALLRIMLKGAETRDWVVGIFQMCLGSVKYNIQDNENDLWV
jgi:hypothetical protein